MDKVMYLAKKTRLWVVNILILSVVMFCFELGQAVAGGVSSFSSRYEQEALAKNEIPEIMSIHPRLLLRSQPWKHGPNVADLRKWVDEEPLKSYLKRRPWNPKPGLELAFRYLLTDNEELVHPIVQNMKKKTGYWPGYLTDLTIQYDWLFNSPSFSPADKRIVEDKIILWAEKAIEMGEEYHDMWSHFGYRPPLDIAAAGLSLYGHRKEAKKYIAMAGGYFKKNMFPGWRLNDGAWQGGWAYYGQGCYNLFKFIALWSSATSEDLFEIIETDQGDWVRNHLYYLIYAMYPDRTPVETCGFNFAPDQRGGTKSALLLTGAYHDLQGVKNINWRKPWGWQLGIDQFLYYSPELRDLNPGQYTLPLTKCWGREGLGYVQMRSDWEDDATIIEFKCGDYFWSHQFHNQNSFTIYHKGRLAIQSGQYAGHYFGPHVLHYYRPTISGNTILVIQPGEKSWIPQKVARQQGIKTQNGYFSDYGGQRSCYMMPKFGSAENCFTFEKYLYRKDHQQHFETGNIKAFEVNDRYSYTCGDAAMAYNNPVFSYPGNKPKLDLFTRQIVFLDKKYLVVFDRVNSLNAKYEKKWLLHSIGKPKFEGNPVEVERPGHREIYKGGLVRIDNQGGTLYCQTLFHDDYLIRRVGGNVTVTEARADPANKGNANLTTEIHGKYKRVSSSIATDKAQEEDWTLEFIDSDHFEIRGSNTGDDGVGSFHSSKKKDIFISNSQAIFIPKENWQGTPRKGDKFFFSVTSPSHRFWINGKNQCPPPKSLIHHINSGSHIDPGNWRIEVFPMKNRKFDTFLHLLYPCDRDTAKPPVSEGIIASGSIMKGIMIDNWIVLFGHKGTIDQKVEYLVNSKDKTANLLLDMKPGKPYLINIISEVSKSNKQKMVASKEGTLFFEVEGTCRVEITPLLHKDQLVTSCQFIRA